MHSRYCTTTTPQYIAPDYALLLRAALHYSTPYYIIHLILRPHTDPWHTIICTMPHYECAIMPSNPYALALYYTAARAVITQYTTGRRKRCCATLHCTTLHGTARHAATLHCTELHCVASRRVALRCVALHYRTLWCTMICDAMRFGTIMYGNNNRLCDDIVYCAVL